MHISCVCLCCTSMLYINEYAIYKHNRYVYILIRYNRIGEIYEQQNRY